VVFAQDMVTQLAQLFGKELAAITGHGDLMHTLAGRWYGWKELWDAWLGLEPLAKVFGSGHSATGAHNDYLQMLYHGGIVGLAFYLILLGAAIVAVLRSLRRGGGPLDVAALMVLGMWLIDSIGLVPSSYPGYQWFVWGFVGLALRMPERTGVQPELVTRNAPIRFRGLHPARTWRGVAGLSP
jgi:hypothetical protein